MKLYTAGLLVIMGKKLLLAFSNNKQCFYLPGGKIVAPETAAMALRREVLEELNVALAVTDLVFYTHITAPAYGEAGGTVMEQDCFMLNRPIDPKASAEIGALQYFSLNEYLRQPRCAPGAVMILQQLTQAGLIKD